jgi:hypothetical protein
MNLDTYGACSQSVLDFLDTDDNDEYNSHLSRLNSNASSNLNNIDQSIAGASNASAAAFHTQRFDSSDFLDNSVGYLIRLTNYNST